MIKYVFPRVFDHTHGAMPLSRADPVAPRPSRSCSCPGPRGYLNSYLIQHAGVRILEAIRADYFRKLQVLPLSFVQSQSTGT